MRRRSLALAALSVLVLPLAHIQLYWTMANIFGKSEAWRLMTSADVISATWPLALASLACSALILACVAPRKVWAYSALIAAVIYNAIIVLGTGELVVHGPLHLLATGVLILVGVTTLQEREAS